MCSCVASEISIFPVILPSHITIIRSLIRRTSVISEEIMTKKKKSILSDQRFIVLLVIIVLFAIFSFKSREFRQYTTILSMLDFSYYDLLMAIGVTFPLITGGVDLSIGTGMVCYALIAGSLVRNNNLPVVLAMLLCIVLGIIVGAANGVLIGIMNLPPFLATLCTCNKRECNTDCHQKIII